MSMLCAGHLYIVWICWRISALCIHIYVRDVSERELPIQLLLLLGRETCSLDYNMYSSIYICSSTISSNGHFIDPPPTPLDIVYFFLLFLLHRQPAATGLYIQTPKKKSIRFYISCRCTYCTHDKENPNGLFSSRSGYSIFHLTLEDVQGNYYPMAVGYAVESIGR